MMHSLPPELRAKLETLAAKKPEARTLIDRLLKKRSEADSPDERAGIEQVLESLVRPSRFGGWLVLPAVVAIVLGVIYWRHQRHLAQVRAGIPTTAQVVRQDSGWCWNGQTETCVRLALRVYPQGAAAYEATFDANVEQRFLSRVQPGSWITVSVNRTDRSKVMYDEEAMAVASPPPVVPSP